MKRYIILLTVFLLLPVFVSATKITRAQRQIDRYNYAKAITILQSVVNNTKYHDQAVVMLAECYDKQRDFDNAKIWYAQAVNLPGVEPATVYNYAMALKASGDYEQAKQMLNKYKQLNPSDPRSNLMLAHVDSITMWKNVKPGYEIKNAQKINTKQSDFGAAYYGDRLVFTSDRSNTIDQVDRYGWTGRGYLDIMASEPSTKGDFWSEMSVPNRFDSKFNQLYHDGPAAFSPDGNEIYFTRTYRDKGKKEGIFKTNLLKIFYAKKVNGVWGKVEPFFLNSNDYSIGHPAFSPDGNTLYFVSDMQGGVGGTDLWKCVRQGDGWSQPENLGAPINTIANEMFPAVQQDATLLFASDGHPGYGALDIFKAEQKGGKWSTPVNLQPPINSSYDDFAMAYAPNSKVGFFSSDRPGGVGSDDIYAFHMLDLPKPPAALPAYITGVVRDKATGTPLRDATVFLLNPASNDVLVLKTDEKGEYKTQLTNPADFQAKGMSSGYTPDCLSFIIKAVEPGKTQTAPRDLLLDKYMINKTFAIENIYYDFDKSFIREDAKPPLNKLVNYMKENPISVELGSHTDCRGSDAYNAALSQRRADAAVKYIIDSGIESKRITAKGYGETQLTNKCSNGVQCTVAEHQANRRTEFKVTGVLTPAEVPGQINLNNYKSGDVIKLNTLPAGFFNDCK